MEPSTVYERFVAACSSGDEVGARALSTDDGWHTSGDSTRRFVEQVRGARVGQRAVGAALEQHGGELAADAIHAGLDGSTITASTFDGYTRDMHHALASFRQLVMAFYDRTFSFGKFIYWSTVRYDH